MAERVVLLTGAGSGIGAATCRAIAAPGLHLVIHARANREGAERSAAAAGARGAETSIELADFANTGAAERLAAAVIAKHGRLDAIVSNAGYAEKKRFGALGAADLDRAHATIARAFLELVTPALDALKASGDGRIIAVSAFGPHLYRDDLPMFPGSAAAKAALETLVRSLAVELGPAHVTVNAVAPGFVKKDPGAHTAMTPAQWDALAAKIPLRRIAEPDDIAGVIAFLLSPAASYITGQVIHVSGGLT
jgi:NAD(P)-dependent dehydrogenase (short-subunit alcohol dehydrogenase family)